MMSTLTPGADPLMRPPMTLQPTIDSDFAKAAHHLPHAYYGQQPLARNPTYPSPPMSKSPTPTQRSSFEDFTTQRAVYQHNPYQPQQRMPLPPVSQHFHSHPKSNQIHVTVPDKTRYQVSDSVLPSSAQAAAKPARRTKAHVQSACYNCKKAHLSCDVQRPCQRCTASGKHDNCFDVEHKKRGRPRLQRDENGFRAQPASRADRALNGLTKTSALTRSDSLRVLKSQDDASRHLPASSVGSDFRSVPHYPSNMPATQGFDSRYLNAPVAFLDLSLKFARTNAAFAGLTGVGDAQGRDLADFVDPVDHRVLADLQRRLREERNAAEPVYLPPLYGGTDAIPVVEATDIDNVTREYRDRPAFLTFRFGGQVFNLTVNFRLAKTDVFFVTLVLPCLDPMAQHPQPQQQHGYPYQQQQHQHHRQSFSATYPYATTPRTTMGMNMSNPTGFAMPMSMSMPMQMQMQQGSGSPYYTFGAPGLISPLPTGPGSAATYNANQASYFMPTGMQQQHPHQAHPQQQQQSMYHFGAGGMDSRHQPRSNASLLGHQQQQQQQQQQQHQQQPSTGANLQLPPLAGVDGDEFRPDKRRRVDVREMLA